MDTSDETLLRAVHAMLARDGPLTAAELAHRLRAPVSDVVRLLGDVVERDGASVTRTVVAHRGHRYPWPCRVRVYHAA